MRIRLRTMVGTALLVTAGAGTGCGVSVTSPNTDWPEVEQLQLVVNGMTVRVRRAGGVSGPVPVLRVGENPVMATAFRAWHGGPENVVQAPRFALHLVPAPFTPLAYAADSASPFSGTLIASVVAPHADVWVMVVEPSTGRIHFGPVSVTVAIIDW